jgi:hypothetical protein
LLYSSSLLLASSTCLKRKSFDPLLTLGEFKIYKKNVVDKCKCMKGTKTQEKEVEKSITEV